MRDWTPEWKAARARLRVGGGRVHGMGIAGVGVAALAQLLRGRGFEVSGCDPATNRLTRGLAGSGMDIAPSHDPAHAEQADWLIHTAAIFPDHPEIARARALGSLVCPRGIALAALMSETRSIAIAGTHGKTTTTAMTVQILKAAGADPWFAVGGEMDAFGGVAGIGRGSWLVAEADESDGTLAWYAPAVAAVTNIDFDHMEHFRDEREFHEVFERFCSRTRGPVLFGRDDAVATRIAGSRPGAAGFGFDPASDIRAEHWAPEGAGQRFDLIVDGLPAGNVFLPVPGRYNALNALGAIAAARAAGVSPEVSGRALGKFRPVRRRMECVHAGAVSVFTDYAHHPAEIRALLGAVLDLRSRAGPGKLSVVFQPHRFTRTRALGEQFPAAFDGADRVVLAPVYAASEAPLEGGRSEDLLVRMERHGRYPVELAASLDDAWARGTRDLRSGDRLLLVGAGDIERLAERAAAEGPSRWP